ncbi:MAG: hypothetical protein CMB66_03350 [Euryarchaeota archaeon]|nr:hypothetical protein [Euryarchaeota archaeon]
MLYAKGLRAQPSGGMRIMSDGDNLDDLRQEMDELKALVNTLLTIIMEEADGINSGDAHPITNLTKTGYSM